MPKSAPEYRHADWVLLRTPARPFDTFAAGVASGELGPAALRAALRDPTVSAALAIASPEMAARLSARADREAGRDDLTLYRYLARMAWRCTPFGLFAGVSLGSVVERGAELRLSALREAIPVVRATVQRVQRAVRAFLATEAAGAVPHRVNDTVVVVHGKLRFSEFPWVVDGPATVVQTAATDAVTETLATVRALGSAPLATIAAVTGRTARFVASLVRVGLLLPDLFPAMTASDPLADARARADRAGEAAHALREALAVLAADVEREWMAVRASLTHAAPSPEAFPRTAESHVDLIRPAAVRVPARVARDVVAAVVELQRWAPPLPDHELLRFRDAFLRRFGSAWVPLGTALDPDHGVAFGDGTPPPSAWASGLPHVATAPAERWDARDAARLRLVGDALARRRHVDLALARDAPNDDVAHWPEGFVAMVQLLAPGANALADATIVLRGIARPSGLQLVGRLAGSVPGLGDAVDMQARQEAARAPAVVFADVAHEPTRLPNGNVLPRPALREAEIVYRGAAGTPAERQLTIDDLLVAVRDGRVVLWSRSRDREVRIRNTNAHLRAPDQSGIYRLFLALMRGDGRIADRWSWGALETLPFLPRVVWRNVILAPARWKAGSEDLGEGDARARVAVLRERTGMPRWVAIVEGDAAFPVDLESELGARCVVDALRSEHAEHTTFEELLPGPEDLCVEGPDGAYCHELLVPFLRDAVESRPAFEPPVIASTVAPVFLPGSEWLYLKVYAAPAHLDALAAELRAEIEACAARSGRAAPRWFFVRYADPDVHLRFRVHAAEDEAGLLRVLDRAHAAGRVTRVQIETYVPELDRYGGAAGTALFDTFSCADSAAVVAAAELLGRDAEARMVAAIIACDRYVQHLCPGDPTDLLDTLAGAAARAAGLGPGFLRELGRRFRAREPFLVAALAPSAAEPWPAVTSLFERAAAAVAPVSDAARAAGLTRPFEAVLGSLLHMHANRILLSSHPADEAVVLHALRKIRGARARARSAKDAPSDRTSAT